MEASQLMQAAFDGVNLSGVVRVDARGQFTGGAGGGTSHRISVSSMGFSQTFYDDDAQVAARWPQEGEVVLMKASVTPTKDGTLRPGSPVFSKPK